MLGNGDSGNNFVVKLRGLPFSTTVDDVVEFLSGVNIKNGNDGIVLTEIRPGRPSGECFVEVESQEDVDEALKKDKMNMGKRYIEVFATDRQDMEWAVNAMNQSGNNFGIPMNISDDKGIVKLRGLPFGCSTDDVIKFFDGLSVSPEGVHLLSDSTGRASGDAFVLFPDKESAEQALEKDREKIGHRYIEVFIVSANEVRSWGHRMESAGGRMPTGRGYGRPVPYDRNDRFSGRYPPRGRGAGYGRGGGGGFGLGRGGGGYRGSRDAAGGHMVHMRGLPFKASPQDIAYFFKPIRPVNINMVFDDNGRPSGEADVEFENQNDAMRAMRRDKNMMEHRYIELFLNGPPAPNSFKPRNFRN